LQFAVVDIETTGGWPNEHGITEIAIVLHDGRKVEHVYEQLVNPQQPIPVYIQGMTGITDAMVSKAPVFATVAAEVYDLLKDKVFVAHNVNFDYSFVKHQLKMAGFECPQSVSWFT
jgi:DNA polymerase-3 subunit epsilon